MTRLLSYIKVRLIGLFKINQKDILNNISIDELLGRETIIRKNPELEEEFRGQIILISGAAGFIGKEICRKLIKYRVKELILVDIAETPLFELQEELNLVGFQYFKIIVSDITDVKSLDRIYSNNKPKIVFHAAAYKHVPLMENNPYSAVKTNILGTKNIANASVKYGVSKFIFISSDKAVNPSNVMGATKRIGELYLSCLKEKGRTKFITTRFGNVIGSTGSVITIFQKQIKSGGPITVTHPEMNRYFMTVSEACQLVLESSAMGLGGEIFTFDMGEPLKIMDLAKRIILNSGLRYPKDIDIKITGLRSGEKLHEELLLDGENAVPTYHDKILTTKVKKLNTENIEAQINLLCSHYQDIQSIELVALLKQIVPEFISQNSRFTILDD